MVFEGVAEDKELLDAIYPFVFVKDYLTRQAACRAIPAVIPVTSIRLHLSRLPSEIEELEGKNADARCGLIELCEVYIRFLMAGDEIDRELCGEVCQTLVKRLPKERHSLVRLGAFH